MKKLFFILLLPVYLLSLTGLTMNVHYCHGKVSSVKFGFEKIKKCPCGKKKPSGDCCKHLAYSISCQAHQKAAYTIPFQALDFNVCLPEIAHFQESNLHLPIATDADSFFAQAYIFKQKAPLYLLFHRLLI